MLAIVDYDAGNVRSVQRACEHVGLTDAEITADPDVVRGADRVIFPGVGSSESAVDTLHNRGLDAALTEFYHSGKPLLGICLGSQIVVEHSEEGDKDCLGLLAGQVKRFQLADPSLKVPHIGWNSVDVVRDHPVLKNISSGDEFYFVHSYYVEPVDPETIYGRTDYGEDFCSMLGQNNLFTTQFHLEKSGRLGLGILEAFGDWDGTPPC
ncbi:MAG: imidazole glycerol phosphate synthase subunit HisH [Gammaproteobacteria bacterium]|uniref:Imidazole glycerol phosphate synthase subunit HisH n=1 Tax=OM182 bacterium MED-G24 TaxID=1986255 RepID=A0A2A5WQW1_9GAMM|nr:imidazole glycerol phosphate synthase subunit HisH [Gammaproteobacteria bacterium]PDH38930.1 MAG: imidazole glycerol phosphate synthase subunit HisH [OM182 bacterium MED-G24]RPG24787.1 MAG: imidazole glycerol phosphate synthase subunit HisH [Gammaproteobacteria bacterium TMED50]